MIEVEALRKSYGEVAILSDVSFSVARGEVLAVIGASGSGKSTLLRCMTFLEDFEGGRILIDGSPVGYESGPARRRLSSSAVAETRTRVGMVFQSFNLFPHKTVLDNVTLGPIHVRKQHRAEAEGRARAILEKVGLGAKIDSYPAQLSGGQQQRVGIARALAMEPEVLLFDEVTSALDPELVDEVLGVMRQLAADGMTMIIVTHEIDFARDIADRVAFFDKGRIAEIGPPERVLDLPQTARLQAFLGRFARGRQNGAARGGA